MRNKINVADDMYISTIITNLNSCLHELFDLKVKKLVPSEDEELNNNYINCYLNLLDKTRDLLLDLFYLNEKYFFGKLSNYCVNKIETFLYIIDLK